MNEPIVNQVHAARNTDGSWHASVIYLDASQSDGDGDDVFTAIVNALQAEREPIRKRPEGAA